MNSRDPTFSDAVTVGVASFNALFVPEWPLAVDTYQRGFVWDAEKMRQLLDDLAEYQRQPDPKPPYYMGAILLHRSVDRQLRFVIDGQQRLTALCVLYHRLRQEVPDGCGLDYSPRSAAHIEGAARACAAWPGKIDPLIFDRIVFTVISVADLDLAFTFFDTQNNRGVPLHATDLLKAYHLRSVASDGDDGSLQRYCAQRWESLQRGSLPLSKPQEVVQSLFSRYLWRARRWTGKRAYQEDHDDLLSEFQDNSVETTGAAGTIPLYRARGNLRALALRVDGDGNRESLEADQDPAAGAADLPFAIRQPIHRGTSFFLYADKYAALLQRLTREATQDAQVLGFRQVFDGMVKANSLYLQEIYLLASLMYVDQFGSNQLLSFSLWLEYAVGALRIEQRQVPRETAQKFFRDDKVNNLLDVIAAAFRPEDVISHLKGRSGEAYAKDEVGAGEGGVRGVYKAAVLAYFGKDFQSLKDKRRWIEQKLSGAAG